MRLDRRSATGRRPTTIYRSGERGQRAATLGMPKKPKRLEVDVHAMIVQDAKTRLGCADFAPDFTLYETGRDAVANWDVQSARNVDWPPDCAQAFEEAVARARRKFDVAWPF
jgi:hypothetical protein